MSQFRIFGVLLLVCLTAAVAVNYPVRFAYIDVIPNWWPPEAIAAGMGVPGFAPPNIYNYIAFAFWLSNGPSDIVKLWSDPITYFGPSSQFGTTKDQIQANLKKRYNDAGIKIMISAFGSTDTPTSAGLDPVAVAKNLSAFVLANNVDGVDIDWEDNAAMNAGTG